MEPTSRIFIAGHTGLVGSALCRILSREGYRNLITSRHRNLDLTNQRQVCSFFRIRRPEYVVVAAGFVGGILANDREPVPFLERNLMIGTNIIQAAFKTRVKRLIYLGSSCIYPRDAPSPIPESALLTGSLEPTNQWYAIAKIACTQLCQAYRAQHGCDFTTVMPCNLYGPNDYYDVSRSHVIPALFHRFHRAKRQKATEAVCLGTGTPKREFLYVDDLARACLRILVQGTDYPTLNVGTRDEVTIQELAESIRMIVGFEGRVRWKTDAPDGTPRKRLDTSRIQTLGWEPEIPLEAGLAITYQDYLSRLREGRLRSGSPTDSADDSAPADTNPK